jgi:hypothetical protein
MNALKYGVAAPLLASLAALFLSAGQATAQPSGPTNGCNPYSGELTSCLGGGPWQNQDGSSPDTYGPTGERGFVYDNRSVGSFPNISDATLLKLGHAICQDLANGFSERATKSVLMRNGVSELDAGAVVISAQMYLC